MKSLPCRHLLLACFFALISLVASGIVRLEFLSPGSRILQAELLAQLQGLSSTLLFHFILLPFLPCVIAYRMIGGRLPYPRLAATAWSLFLIGAALLLLAFMNKGMEAGWMYAVSSPITRDSVSFSLLLGLACGSLGMELVSLNLLAGFRNLKEPPSLLQHSFIVCSWLLLISLPLLLASLVFGMGQLLIGPSSSDAAAAGVSLLPARLYAFAKTPLQTTILLPALGILATALLPRTRDRLLETLMTGLAVLSVLAIDQNVGGGGIAPFLALTASFYHALFAITLLLFVGRTLARAITQDPGLLRSRTGSQLYAGSAAAVLLLYGPLSLLLNTLGVHEIFSASYLRVLHGGLLILLVFLGFLTDLFSQREQHGQALRSAAPVKLAIGLLGLGFLTTLPPLLALGRSTVPATVTAYPASLQQLQIAVTLGGGLMILALLANLGVASFCKPK